MPRKSDGMLFELHPLPTKGEDERNLDSLCYGAEPTLKREKIGNTYQYFPLQK